MYIDTSTGIYGIPFANQGSAPTTPAAGYVKLYSRANALLTKRSDASICPVTPPIAGGRLTLTSGTPVTTSDVTAAGTLYYTPYMGDMILLYDGSSDWIPLQFVETSLALTLTSGSVYDIFAYNNAGTLALEALVWTNTTTRATGLTYQNGRLVKSGAPTRLFLGTICASGTNTAEDSVSRRLVWNAYNRVLRPVFKQDTTATWTMTSSTWRQTRATAANMVEVVTGWQDTLAWFEFTQMQSGGEAFGGIGIDSNTPGSASCYIYNGPSYTFYDKALAPGYHQIRMCERGISAATVTFYGAYSGENLTTLDGWVMA